MSRDEGKNTISLHITLQTLSPSLTQKETGYHMLNPKP